MVRWLKFFFDVCLLKAAPQDAPSSKTVMYATILAYWLTGLSLTLLNQDFLPAVIITTLQTAIALFFINLALWIRQHPDRIAQTLAAFAGSGIIIVLVGIPLVSWYQPESDAGSILQFLGLLLIIWQTLVIGHILKHALEIPLYAGLGVALIYMYLSFAITLRFVKLMSVSLG